MKTGKDFLEKLSGELQSAVEKTQAKVKSTFADDDCEVSDNFGYCSNCGAKLGENSKFCHSCGSAVGEKASAFQNPPPIPDEADNSGRQQQYVGKILKCPNCGNILSETTVVCPACGMQITGRSAVSSVQMFSEQLMNIESHKTKTLAGFLGIRGSAEEQVDKQKLALIRTFPILNTIDDILEFVMLAIANIDVSLSKKLRSGREDLAADMPRIISNAWVLKLQQAYQKAEIMFPNTPAFFKIQRIYFNKMSELKIKINKK